MAPFGRPNEKREGGQHYGEGPPKRALAVMVSGFSAR